jgi:chromosome segregation ATPase
MKTNHTILHYLLIGLFLMIAASAGAAEKKGVNAAEQKMRETIRNTMVQLRDTNAKLAAAQAAQAEAEEKTKELQGQLEELTKKSAAEKKSSDETIDELRAKLAASEQQVIHYTESLAKWKLGYGKLAEYAKATEGKRAELASRVIMQDRKIADQQVKNAEMYRLGTEVLDRYAKFSLGTAIAAREPFVGITKIKFENLVQEYQSKLSDQTIRHESPSDKKSN